jgi:hypothetical protein
VTAAIGLSAHIGWAAAATIAPGMPVVRVLRSERLELLKPDDLETGAPYHVAAGFLGLRRVPPPKHPEQSLKKGLQRQQRSAARLVAELCATLEAAGFRLEWAGLLVSRGRAAATFAEAIASHTQVRSVRSSLVVRMRSGDRMTPTPCLLCGWPCDRAAAAVVLDEALRHGSRRKAVASERSGCG